MNRAAFIAKARTHLLVGYTFETPEEKQAFDREMAEQMKATKHPNLLADLATERRDATIASFLTALEAKDEGD
jgi:hypothetical protein